MASKERIALIKEIEKARGSRLIVYAGSTRQGIGASYDMQQLDIRVLADHLESIGKNKKIDLLINSFGGDVTFPWRLVNLIREYGAEFHVIIPLHAFSAATLISMGANSITMLPAACLGPTDPSSNSPYNPRSDDLSSVLPVNEEDITYFLKFINEDLNIKSDNGLIDALKILSESDKRLHPVAIGHAKRGTKLAEKYTRELLSLHMSNKTTINKIVKTLGKDLYAHDHPINRKEAKALGLNIVIEKPEVEDKIWKLFLDYESEMQLKSPFDAIAEFKKIQPVLPLSVGNSLQPVQQTIPPIQLVIIESEKITDTLKRELDVTGISFLDNNGKLNYQYSWVQKSLSWDHVVR